MKRSVFLQLLALCLLLTALAPRAFASETEETVEETTEATEESPRSRVTSGSCGDGIFWKLEDSTLVISGSGEMEDGCPWEAHQDKVRSVVFTGGITYVGAGAFEDFDKLKTIDFGDAMKVIGARAFYSCDALTYILLPDSFRRFEAEAFRDCINLQQVYINSNIMPTFRDSCLFTDHQISVYHPVGAGWPQEEVDRLLGNFGSRLSISAANLDVLDDLEEDMEALATVEAVEVTEAAEPETEPPVTVPVVVTEATEAATEPPVTTVPETQAPTEVPTEAPTEPEETESIDTVAEKVGGDGWKGLVLIAGVFTFLAAGVLIFRGGRNKGGRYSG